MPRRPVLAMFPAGLALLLLSGTLAPSAAAAEDMAVKMQWDETLYRDEVSRVNLEITNINELYIMNVTSAGLYIDWMKLGTFEKNTTSFMLESGQRKAVTIFFRVPVDARLGKHSDYIVIHYALYNSSAGTWKNGTFESEIGQDFSVVERPAPARDWFAISVSNPLCVAGLVVAVLGPAGLVAWRYRRTWRHHPNRVVERPPPDPAPPGPAPPPPEERKQDEGPAQCPICGAPNPGRHCQNCDWDIG